MRTYVRARCRTYVRTYVRACACENVRSFKGSFFHARPPLCPLLLPSRPATSWSYSSSLFLAYVACEYVRAYVLPYIASCSGVLAAGRVSFSLSGCQPGAAPACAMATFAALMTQKKRKPEGVVLGRPQKCHIRDPQTVEASIAHGQRVVQFLRARYGKV